MPSGFPGKNGMLFLRNKGCMFLDNFFHLRIIDEIVPFMRIISQIVELTGTVKVLDKTIVGRPYRIITQPKTCNRGMIPFSLRVFHQRNQALSFLSFIFWQTGQFKQGGERYPKVQQDDSSFGQPYALVLPQPQAPGFRPPIGNASPSVPFLRDGTHDQKTRQ